MIIQETPSVYTDKLAEILDPISTSNAKAIIFSWFIGLASTLWGDFDVGLIKGFLLFFGGMFLVALLLGALPTLILAYAVKKSSDPIANVNVFYIIGAAGSIASFLLAKPATIWLAELF